MAGVHSGIVGQREQLGGNAAQQRGVVAAGQVGTANAASEQHIAPNQLLAWGMIKHDMARRVARRETYFQLRLAYPYGLAGRQFPSGLGRLIARKAIRTRIHGHRAERGQISRVQQKGNARISAQHKLIAQYMVDVRVRVEQYLYFQALRFYVGFQLLLFGYIVAARVYYGSGGSSFINQQVGVFSKGVEGEADNFHRSGDGQRVREVARYGRSSEPISAGPVSSGLLYLARLMPPSPVLPAQPPITCDFLLVGHGIAGALLGWELRRRGYRVLVYDAPQPDSASRVAAGLMNPVAGKRFALTWRAADFLPTAAVAYQALEAEFAQRFFFPTPIFKVFGSGQEQQDTLTRGATRPWGDFVAELTSEDPQLPGLKAPFGGAWLQHGGYVAVRELLTALTAQGLAAGWLRAETFEWAHLVSDATGVAYAPGHVRTTRVVCCEGAAAAHNPYFNWLPLTPNQGEVLDVVCPGLSSTQVLNRGAYVVPVGNGQFRVGATYRWPPFVSGCTPEGEAELASRLAALTDQPFRVVGRQVGVRPAVRDRKPLLGAHPVLPWLSFCGGYGSKGVMMAPRLATLLVDWLEGSTELWPEVDLKRYDKVRT